MSHNTTPISDTTGTNLVLVDLEQLPSTQIGSDDQFTDLAKSGDFLQPLAALHEGQGGQPQARRPRQLRHRGQCDEQVKDLGDKIDIVPLARRPKAIDMTDNEAIIVSYEPGQHRVQADRRAVGGEGKSHCMYGPSFLVFERKTASFLEFFCGNKSSRSEAKNIYPFLPLTQADIDAKAARGDDVSNLEPHGPLPLDAQEPARGEGHLLVARSRCREVPGGVHEPASGGADRQGDYGVSHREGQRRGACDRPRQRRSRPLVVICSVLDLPSAPARFLSHPPHRSRTPGDVHHGRVSTSLLRGRGVPAAKRALPL